MIIDCHVHLNNYTEEPTTLEQRFQRMQAQLDKYGIDHAFVITSYAAHDKRPSVDEVIKVCRQDPRLHVVEGVSLYGKAPFSLQAIEERLRRRDIIALKLYPGYEYYYPTDKICRPIYELAIEYDVPVMVHTGDCYNPKAKVKYAHPLHLDEVAVDYPELRIVMAHLGNPWFRDTAEVIYKNSNVYADISGLVLGDIAENFEAWLKQQVREIIQFAGEPDKLLYGTDWPIVNMGPYLKLMDSLDLDPEAREKLLWKNTVRVFKHPNIEVASPTRREVNA
ncbi:MAG TPA: amidohydrolase family protein [Candidatus Thermoplasmatota archaeon]|nr:amidohydrolase family protein [Candidatus Thermoplasmatota archaeon]